MLKIKHSQLNWLLAGMTLAVMGVSIAPASAQRVIVIDGAYGARRSPAVGSFIYSSPIPTPGYGARRSPAVGSFIYSSPIPTPGYGARRSPAVGSFIYSSPIPTPGYGDRRSPAVGSFIYGSPIPTPMPVDPTTGLIPQRTHYYNYSYPQIRQNVRNSTLINPTWINPAIPDSTIVNPVIIDNSWHRRSFSGERSLVNPVIINNSWHHRPFNGGRSRVFIYPR
ncbi:hypothetical protein [Nostoc sp. JL33]|uniref:hypothetical protein n=1 Tax=Nostoc sp. JL33 TaxID=2815396 RepID=UPI0025D5984C|nr:hypothetical protein [Nostoc sp. JL33]